MRWDGEDFIKTYLEYTKSQESPRAFHYWTAIGLISTMLGRNVWFRQGITGKIFPNHFVVLVADSALARKSTAFAKIGVPRVFRPSLGLLHEASLGADAPFIMATKVTPERIIEKLDGKVQNPPEDRMDYQVPTTALLYASELGVFMSRGAQTSGLTDILIDLYDNPDYWEYSTKTSGEYKLYNLSVTLISATTPSWIASNFTSDLFNQGLIGRCIFVYGPGPRHLEPLLELTPEEVRLETELIQQLKRFSYLYGTMRLDEEAEAEYRKWYIGRAKKEEDVKSSGFFGRQQDHVLKLAMCLSASKRDTKIITLAEMTESIHQLDLVSDSLPLVFKDMQANYDIPEVRIVETAIRVAKEIKHSDLLRKVYRKVERKKLHECLQLLKLADIIIEESRKPTRGKPAVWYKIREKGT